MTEEKAKWYLETLKNVQGLHYLQEDHPHWICEEIAARIDMI